MAGPVKAMEFEVEALRMGCIRNFSVAVEKYEDIGFAAFLLLHFVFYSFYDQGFVCAGKCI